jgi:hypothetical protein
MTKNLRVVEEMVTNHVVMVLDAQAIVLYSSNGSDSYVGGCKLTIGKRYDVMQCNVISTFDFG